MARDIQKILISTMPRSGTVFFFNFIAELFNFEKLDPFFTEGIKPNPPEWDPYKFDKTYLALEKNQVLCAHYHLTEDIKKIICQPNILTIYLYRDPRDAAVSAALYIKNSLTHHPLHSLFSSLSDSEAITLMLSGGLVNVTDNDDMSSSYIAHDGMKYFCDIALDWINHPNVISIRYEDYINQSISNLFTLFRGANIEVNEKIFLELVSKFDFSVFSGGREKGQENIKSHYRKGVSGDYKNYFNGLHKAICKQRFGQHLIKLGYEKDLCW